MAEQTKAVVLFSGGLDSTTTLAVAQQEGFEVYALSVDYGQRHLVELEFAAKQLALRNVAHTLLLRLDLRTIGGSALTSTAVIPVDRNLAAIRSGIPPTYVPARNTILLSLAAAWAETLGTGHIFIGITGIDAAGYPDCKPGFVAAFEATANLGLRAPVEGRFGIEIHCPLIQLSKGEIIRLGSRLGVDYSATLSCYQPTSEGIVCGRCDACVLRLAGFREAGIADPAKYLAR